MIFVKEKKVKVCYRFSYILKIVYIFGNYILVDILRNMIRVWWEMESMIYKGLKIRLMEE